MARSEGCKQRTDPYLFSPDKTKLRYRLSFVIFHCISLIKKRVKMCPMLQLSDFPSCFIHILDTVLYTFATILCLCPQCCYLLCSRHGCCCVYVPDAAVVHIVDAVVFMYLTLPCLHPQLCHVHISDSAVFTLALLILPCSDPQHYCLLVPNVVVFKCPFKSLTFCVHVIMAVSRM